MDTVGNKHGKKGILGGLATVFAAFLDKRSGGKGLATGMPEGKNPSPVASSVSNLSERGGKDWGASHSDVSTDGMAERFVERQDENAVLASTEVLDDSFPCDVLVEDDAPGAHQGIKNCTEINCGQVASTDIEICDSESIAQNPNTDASSLSEVPSDASTISDDSEWDEIFGWSYDDPEWSSSTIDEWDDAPSSAEKPSEQTLLSVSEWAESRTDVSGKILMCLLKGLTPVEAASECRVPRSTVESLLEYGLHRLPMLKEDAFSYVYIAYSISLDDFVALFEQPAETYRYLELVYKRGEEDIGGMLDDPQISDDVKKRILERYPEIANSHDGSDKTDVDEVNANNAETSAVEPSELAPTEEQSIPVSTNAPTSEDVQTPVTADDSVFGGKFDGLLSAFDLPTQGLQTEMAHGALTEPDDSAKADDRTSGVVAMQGETIAPKHARTSEKTLPVIEDSDWNQERLVKAVLEIARNNTEYSTNYFLRELPELADEMGVKQRRAITREKQFYLIVRRAFEGHENVSFPSGYQICFGTASRYKQIYDLMVELSPISAEALMSEYERLYGVGRSTLNVWFRCIDDYRRDDVYSVAFGQDGSSGSNSQGSSHESSLDQAPDDHIPSSVAAEHGVMLGTSTEGIAAEVKSVISKLPIRLQRLVHDVIEIAEDDTEYSTNYFYYEFSSLVIPLNVKRERYTNLHRDFFEKFKEAFEGFENVSFPGGYLVCFGSPDRYGQLFDLMEELSPVDESDLRREYERRYGINQATVANWLSCLYAYRCGDTFSLDYGPSNHYRAGSRATTKTTEIHHVPIVLKPRKDPPKAFKYLKSLYGVDDFRMVREAIDRIASKDTEYTTDYFYLALPNLAKQLSIRDKFDFYFLVRDAYEGFEYASFPIGHLVRFGDADRERQMYNLLCELSPISAEDLAITYESRYGFSRNLVRRWYRRYNAYEENGIFRIVSDDACDSDQNAGDGVDGQFPSEQPPAIDEAEISREVLVASTEDDARIMGEDDNTLAEESESVEVPQEGAGSLPNEEEVPQDIVPSVSGDEFAEHQPRPKPSVRVAPKPKTAIDWALSLEGPYRQVVQQVLFGNTLNRVATNTGLSVDQVREMLITSMADCPTVREDSYLIHFHIYKSMREFCAKTNEPEATYYFLYWRDRAAGKSQERLERDIAAEHTSADLQADAGGASVQRRMMREAARAERRQERAGMPGASSQEMIEMRSEPSNVTRSVAQKKRNVADVPPIRPSSSRAVTARRIARGVDKLATSNREYAIGYFYHAMHVLMQRYKIKSETELYDLLRFAYRHDDDITFEGTSIIRFGRCDRRAQLEALLKEDRSIDYDTFVLTYSRRYGFEFEQVVKWIEEFRLDLPKSGSLFASSSPTSLPYHTAFSDGRPSQDLYPVVDVHRDEKNGATATAVRGQIAGVRESPSPTSRASVHAQTIAEYERFLRSELNADCCDRRLVVERFQAQFPRGPKDPFSDEMLRRLGYRPKGKKLLFRRDVKYDEYFEQLINSQTLFSRGDNGFENAIFNDPQFRQILRGKMRSFDIVEYERDSFIRTEYLCNQMGVSVGDVRSYSQDVARNLRERQGASVPFTIWSLRERYHINHPLDVLTTDGGMSDYLFETLFDIDPGVQCCTISKRRVFLETTGSFNASNFIECLIEMNGALELGDLVDLLRDDYGIEYTERALHRIISSSSLYYDDLTDSVYNSFMEWEEMVERELA